MATWLGLRLELGLGFSAHLHDPLLDHRLELALDVAVLRLHIGDGQPDRVVIMTAVQTVTDDTMHVSSYEALMRYSSILSKQALSALSAAPVMISFEVSPWTANDRDDETDDTMVRTPTLTLSLTLTLALTRCATGCRCCATCCSRCSCWSRASA